MMTIEKLIELYEKELVDNKNYIKTLYDDEDAEELAAAYSEKEMLNRIIQDLKRVNQPTRWTEGELGLEY